MKKESMKRKKYKLIAIRMWFAVAFVLYWVSLYVMTSTNKVESPLWCACFVLCLLLMLGLHNMEEKVKGEKHPEDFNEYLQHYMGEKMPNKSGNSR